MRRLLVALIVVPLLTGCGLYYAQQRREWEEQARQADAAYERDVRGQYARTCAARGRPLPGDYVFRTLPDAPGRTFYLAVELETVLGQPSPCGLSRTERFRVANEAFRRHLFPYQSVDFREVNTWLAAVDVLLADMFDEGKIRAAQAEFLALEARRLGYGELRDRRMRAAAIGAQEAAAAAQQSQAAAAWGRVFQEEWRRSQPGTPIPATPVGPIQIRIVP